jgi:diacylglycerol kinase (ATP)
VEWVLNEGIGRLVVWGGDGTFHRVVTALWRRHALEKVELALVPAGTCNDLSRRLSLSKYFWRRWEKPLPEGSRLGTLTLTRMGWTGDGAAGEDIFVNNAGFGRPRSSFVKKEGAWGVLRSFQRIPVKVAWDGGEMSAQSYMVLAVSGPYFSGGLHFEREPSPENGKISVYFVPARSKARLAAKLLWGRMGFQLFDAKTTVLRTQRLTIETDIPVWPQVDGEPPPEAGVRRLTFDVLPEKVKLWIPQS